MTEPPPNHLLRLVVDVPDIDPALAATMSAYGIVTLTQAHGFLGSLLADPALCAALGLSDAKVADLLARLPKPPVALHRFTPPPAGALAPHGQDGPGKPDGPGEPDGPESRTATCPDQE